MTLKFNGQCDTCARPLMGAVNCGGTGYAIDQLARRHCYQCCADHDWASLRAGKPQCLYLTGDNASKQWGISNWPGSLELRAMNVRKSYGYGFGRRYDRYDVWFTFEGRQWHGVNQGDNQILRCKQLKGRA